MNQPYPVGGVVPPPNPGAHVTLPLTHPTNNCASLLKTPEEIAKTYSSLSLEQVYATILYYLHEQEKITNYLTEWIEHGERMREIQKQNPPPVAEKLRKLRQQRKAVKQVNESEISLR